jgi:uncharacterized membrane protein
MSTEKPRSNWWFLLPIFIGIIGGVIAYFVLRHDDPRKAKNCLYLGLVLMIISIAINVIFGAQLMELENDFGVNT